MNILDKAIKFAIDAHSGMFRKETKIPYIVHPLEAAFIAATMTTDEEVIAAAVLHDVIEDTSVCEEQLLLEFGSRITNLVCFDSENKRPERPASETWALRKQETLNNLSIANMDEQIVVLADKLSNIRSIYRDLQDYGDSLWNRFNIKDKSMHCWYYKGIAERLDKVRDTHAYTEFIDLVKKVFNNCEIKNIVIQPQDKCIKNGQQDKKAFYVDITKMNKQTTVKIDDKYMDTIFDGKQKCNSIKLDHYSWLEDSPYRNYEKEYVNLTIENTIETLIENEFFRWDTEYSKKALRKLLKIVQYGGDLPSCSEWEDTAEFEQVALYELVKIVKCKEISSVVDALDEVKKKLCEAKLFEDAKNEQLYERLHYELTECSIKEFEAFKREVIK